MGFESWPKDSMSVPASGDGGASLLASKQPSFPEEEGEDCDESAFASLECFKSRKGKKKPVLTVDPDELAKEYEQFQMGAAKLVEGEEPVQHKQVDFLGLNPMGADDEAEGEGLDGEEALSDAAEAAPRPARQPIRFEDVDVDLPAEPEPEPEVEEEDWNEAEAAEIQGQPDFSGMEEPEEPQPAEPPRSMDHLLHGEDEEDEPESVIPSIMEQLKKMRALPKPLDADALAQEDEQPGEPVDIGPVDMDPIDMDPVDVGEDATATPSETPGDDDWDDWEPAAPEHPVPEEAAPEDIAPEPEPDSEPDPVAESEPEPAPEPEPEPEPVAESDKVAEEAEDYSAPMAFDPSPSFGIGDGVDGAEDLDFSAPEEEPLDLSEEQAVPGFDSIVPEEEAEDTGEPAYELVSEESPVEDGLAEDPPAENSLAEDILPDAPEAGDPDAPSDAVEEAGEAETITSSTEYFEEDDGPDLSWMMPQQRRELHISEGQHSSLRARLVQDSESDGAEDRLPLMHGLRGWAIGAVLLAALATAGYFLI